MQSIQSNTSILPTYTNRNYGGAGCTGFVYQHAFPVNQATAPEHWPQPRKIIYWPHPFLIHHLPTNGKYLSLAPSLVTGWQTQDVNAAMPQLWVKPAIFDYKSNNQLIMSPLHINDRPVTNKPKINAIKITKI